MSEFKEQTDTIHSDLKKLKYYQICLEYCLFHILETPEQF